MDASVSVAALRSRAKLNGKLGKANDAVTKAAKGLSVAIAAYTKEHVAAAKHGKLVPTSKHTKLVNGVTKAREKLTTKFTNLQAVEIEWKEYFTPL